MILAQVNFRRSRRAKTTQVQGETLLRGIHHSQKRSRGHSISDRCRSLVNIHPRSSFVNSQGRTREGLSVSSFPCHRGLSMCRPPVGCAVCGGSEERQKHESSRHVAGRPRSHLLEVATNERAHETPDFSGRPICRFMDGPLRGVARG